MAAIRGFNTKPEIVVRSFLHSAGLRFRLHKKDVPGRPDLFFRKYNTVVFINGCFWHQHPGCRFAYKPKSNRAFWIPKLQGNALRDTKNIKLLKSKGYKVIVIWECEIRKAQKVKKNTGFFLKLTQKIIK